MSAVAGKSNERKRSLLAIELAALVVERTHSWPNRSRLLLVRWEKKVEQYLAFLHLACAQLIFARAAVFG
jgi:putative transposase